MEKYYHVYMLHFFQYDSFKIFSPNFSVNTKKISQTHQFRNGNILYWVFIIFIFRLIAFIFNIYASLIKKYLYYFN